MPALISLIVAIVIFAICAYGMLWVCQRFGLPQPIQWICGALLLIVILLYVSGEVHLPVSLPR